MEAAVNEPLRLYVSKCLPITERLPKRDFTSLCLVQTAELIGLLQIVDNELKLSSLMKNVFYDAVDLPQLGLVVAINAHKRLAAYGYNGKCYGRCEFAFKPRAFVMIPSGGFMCYTYDDRLVHLFMKVVDNGRRVEFVANGLSSPRI